ncbi:MAG: hemerythrin domain-containing protein [Azonexus sp.]
MEKNKALLISDEKFQGKISWSDNMLVGHAQIDTNHREFIILANELMSTCEKSALTTLLKMERHLISHFDDEEFLMEKTEFPGPECHIDEHGKVFDAVALVKERYSAGTATLSDVKRLGQALIDWFPGHIFYMDSALSNWISKKKHNGSPIIFRRNALQVIK